MYGGFGFHTDILARMQSAVCRYFCNSAKNSLHSRKILVYSTSHQQQENDLNYERTDSAPGYAHGYSSMTDYKMSTQTHADQLAMEQVTGGNVELTAETFSEFLSTATERRTPLLTHTHWLVGPISDAELLGLMLHTSHGDFMVAAACRELTARYLADLNTCAVVDSLADKIGEMA